MYDNQGNEIFATRISTGRKGFATPTGEFVITDKYRDWTSTLYHASMPYFQRLSCSDFGACRLRSRLSGIARLHPGARRQRRQTVLDDQAG